MVRWRYIRGKEKRERGRKGILSFCQYSLYLPFTSTGTLKTNKLEHVVLVWVFSPPRSRTSKGHTDSWFKPEYNINYQIIMKQHILHDLQSKNSIQDFVLHRAHITAHTIAPHQFSKQHVSQPISGSVLDFSPFAQRSRTSCVRSSASASLSACPSAFWVISPHFTSHSSLNPSFF